MSWTYTFTKRRWLCQEHEVDFFLLERATNTSTVSASAAPTRERPPTSKLRTERTLLRSFNHATLPEVVNRNSGAMFGITSGFSHPAPVESETDDHLSFGFPGPDHSPGPPVLPAIGNVKRVTFSMSKQKSECRLWAKVGKIKYTVSFIQILSGSVITHSLHSVAWGLCSG